MGLFTSDKNPCAVCGGPTARLMATEIDGEKVCGDCMKWVSMGEKKFENLTIPKLKNHIEDRKENERILNEVFRETRLIPYDYNNHVVIDDENKMFYIETYATKNYPIFKFDELEGFFYREWIHGKFERMALDVKGSVPILGQDERMEKKAGMRTVIRCTKDQRTEGNSFIEILRDEYHGVVRWDNIVSELMGMDDKLMSTEHPIKQGRMVFKLKNKWYGKFKVDLMLPKNRKDASNKKSELFNYIERYDEILDRMREIARVMGSILDETP